MVRVILIDDEESALDYLEMLLTDIGGIAIIGKYANPVLALEELVPLKPDVVFVDIQMPGIQGMDLAGRILETLPDTKILFTTAYSEYAIKAFEMNATDYLLKPFTKNRLSNAVSRILEPSHKADASAKIHIQLMGGLYVHAPGIKNGAIPWRTNKVRELFAYMLHHMDRPVKSDEMIESIWPDQDPVNARTYLYTCLSFLRKHLKEYDLPIQIVKYGNTGYMLIMEGIPVDASEFAELVARLGAGTEHDARDIARLMELYQGGYLLGCDYEWAVPQRDRLRYKFITILQQQYQTDLEHGRLEPAEQCLRTILELSPEAEREARELMRIFLHKGRKSEAMKVYHRLAVEVCDNLGAELEQETVEFRRTLLV